MTRLVPTVRHSSGELTTFPTNMISARSVISSNAGGMTVVALAVARRSPATPKANHRRNALQTCSLSQYRCGVTDKNLVFGRRAGTQRCAGILALVYVRKVDQEKMLSSLKERYPERTTSVYGARTLYSWTARHPRGETPMTGAFASDQLIVIGQDAEEVKAALDVLDGKRPGITSNSPLLADVSPQAIFVSKGVDVSADDRARTRCPVLRNCEAASVQWSQQDGVLTAAYRLAATSEEGAQAYQTVVAGFKALAGLRSQDSPAMSGLLQGLTYRADGKVFTANWEAKVQAVREAMEQMKQSGGRCPLAH